MRKPRTTDNTPELFPGLKRQFQVARTTRKALKILAGFTSEERRKFVEILESGVGDDDGKPTSPAQVL
jgi:hypothetical protein